MKPALQDNSIGVGTRFSFRLERTIRVPDDGKQYPLPPTFGPFPVYRARDYRDKLPASWAGGAAFFVPMRQWEALWLSFRAEEWKPNAVQVASGEINALTGERFTGRLSGKPQNYLVCPLQPWLDGFRTGPGVVRQFVAAPLGQGVTVEEQLTGAEARGGLRVRVYEPKPGRFPDRKPRNFASSLMALESMAPVEMGLGAGGAIEQSIYPDPHGVSTWDAASGVTVEIGLLNSAAFREITGLEPPPSTITAADYSRLGFPWFRLYDEDLGDVGATSAMRGVKSLGIHDETAEPGEVRGIRRRKGKAAT